jgi:hypothetical protein
MKKIILGLLAVTSFATANAQKNSILVYGNVGLNINNQDNGPVGGSVNTTNWNVTPGIGYQFHNNWTVGIQGAIGMNNTDVTAPYQLDATKNATFTNSSTDWRAGAFLRHTHYFNNMFSLWHQLDLGYMGGSTSQDTLGATATPSSIVKGQREDSYSGFGAMITPAIGVHIWDGFALNFSFGGLGFNTVSWDKAPVTETNINFTFGQQFNFGISKNFGCGKKKGHGEPGMEMRKMKKHNADEDDE